MVHNLIYMYHDWDSILFWSILGALKRTPLTPLSPPAAPLPALKVLDLQDNALQGHLPGWLPPVLSISLGDNMFTGTLPSSLTTAPLVQHLNVEGNRLTGSIPEFRVGSLEVGHRKSTLLLLFAIDRIHEIYV
jgi:hypothetical protein